MTRLDYRMLHEELPRRPQRQKRFFPRLVRNLLLWGVVSVVLIVVFFYVRQPDVNELRSVRYQQPLRIYTADGALISQIGTIKRTPIEYEEIPQDLINALLVAEDSRFFAHRGLDPRSFARAVYQFITKSPNQTGASTITMQVARNYYLTRERTIIRKVNEIFLALKMERFLSKEEIMALYVNTIFLGFQSYGMAAAAQTYYNKDLQDLSLAQYAMLASLPKSPSGSNPISNPARARERRDWILSRLLSFGYISRAAYEFASQQELSAAPYDYTTEVEGLYLSESARLEVLSAPAKYRIIEDDIYTAGYKIFTTARRDHQSYASRALRRGLLEYDKRHGWRGAERKIAALDEPSKFTSDNPEYVEFLRELATISSYDGSLEPAVVREVNETSLVVVLAGGTEQFISWDGIKWAAPYISDAVIGAPPTDTSGIVEVGDLIRLSPEPDGTLRISQIPRANGAVLAVEPQTGFITAMVGGYHFQLTKYNRALQARRQIGSAIKPFLYTYALERGYNGADILKDAPFVSESTSNIVWRPSNAGDRFLGDIPLREGLYRSRNLVSVRLMQSLGIFETHDFMQTFGFPAEHLPRDLSLGLGSAELTLFEVARAYGVFANGGYLLEPQFILRVEDADGGVLYQANSSLAVESDYLTPECRLCARLNSQANLNAEELELLSCNLCIFDDVSRIEKLREIYYGNNTTLAATADLAPVPAEPNAAALAAKRIISPQTHYQINSILTDVVQRGTARRAAELNRDDLAGKTGTTQNFVDAWFAGYNPDLVAVSWVGFDEPTPLGPIEYGGVTALPIWQEFIGNALESVPLRYFNRPVDLLEVNVTIDNEGGFRQFSDYINLRHLNAYLARIKDDSAYSNYEYEFLAREALEALNITQAVSTREERANSEKVNQELKELF